MPLSPSASPVSRPNKAERAAAERAAYDAGVFVNCPFDDGYKPLFNATVFAVLDCGFEPRWVGSGQVLMWTGSVRPARSGPVRTRSARGTRPQ
jgi:hypothetical protein